MNVTAAVITVSDKSARGERKDTSGPALCEMLAAHGYRVVHTRIIPDDAAQIQNELIHCADELHIELVLTTGGTGFSPRDVTPEATLSVVERRTPGIPEAMRAESLRITPKGCLSRSEAGIRGKTLIINLPGSEKAAKENFAAVLDAVAHGMEMLGGSGSADCGEPTKKKTPPSMDAWLREAKKDTSADKVGMYLIHNGTVRATARAQARNGEVAASVRGMVFSYDAEAVDRAIAETYRLPGVQYVRVWLNEGTLAVGDDIMYVLLGADIRPNTISALESLVAKIKTHCVTEQELFS